MRKIAVIGAGYVGLTTAACLARLGHAVRCTDLDADKIAQLQAGSVPVVELGLESLVRAGKASRRLSFELGSIDAAAEAEFVFLCLPTPELGGGAVDVSAIDGTIRDVGPHLAPGSIVVNKSTAPVGTARRIAEALGRRDVAVVANPEFLREGTAVQDFLHPDRIVIGADRPVDATRVARLYLGTGAPVVTTDLASAETIKYVSNAFLATKISFVNAVAVLCEAMGADVADVTTGMGLDRRIGADFLRPGPGWGGPCFPKDVRALVRVADGIGLDFRLLKGAIADNEDQQERVLAKLERLAGGKLAGATVAMWGLTFKAGTGDLRCSPAVAISHRLVLAGASVRAYDPTVAETQEEVDHVEIASSPLAACVGADVLLVATEWDEFRTQDVDAVASVMARRAVVDARNVLDRVALARAGFDYAGVGVA